MSMQHSRTDYILLHLSLIDGVGAVTIGQLLNRFGQEGIAQIYEMSTDDLVRHGALAYGQAQKIVAGLADIDSLHREDERCAKHAIAWMTLADENYPTVLKHIHAPPPVFYWQGALPTCEHALAVVGSRNATSYGQRVIDRLIPPLVRNGCVIVSGGAAGVDTMAHRAAVEHQGKTVVVLGSGLLHWYPARNKPLFEAIIASGGCVMSAFPLLTEPLPGNFPARNRIIAGLAQATLVVQAAAKSGALITAQYALDQGREVMAVPGPIDDLLSEGCHTLIGQGALLVTTPDAIVHALHMPAPNQVPTRQEQIQLSIPHHTQLTSTAKPATEHDRLVALCKNPASVDELMEQTAFSSQQLVTLLFELQLAGRITQDFTGRWQAAI